MEHTDEIKTYTIAEWNMGKVHQKVDRLNRRAEKLGCPKITLDIIEERFVPDPSKIDPSMTGSRIKELPKIKVYDLTITGEGPKLEGWKFIGTLDHKTIPGKVIVNAVPGETVPEEYFDSEPVCTHCGKHRYRKETFVMEHENGEREQVGRSCIRDFLGHDPQAIARYLQSMYKLIGELEDEEGFGFGGGARDWYYSKDMVLQVTAALIDKYGWVSSSMARNHHGEDAPTATSHLVHYWFNAPYNAKEREQWKKFKEELDAENERWKADVAPAREWLAEQKADNEYMHNLTMINESEGNSFNVKLTGYWCSLMSTYQRAQERLKQWEAEKKLKVNEHLGEVKERLEMVVTVKRKRMIDSYYGPVTIVNMLTDTGHTVVWFANTDVEMYKGEKYLVKATVKKHDEYNDWKQTVVSRLSVIEEVKEEAA